VIAPRKLDEQRTGVKTDPRDASTLCQRLSRYVDGRGGGGDKGRLVTGEPTPASWP
jgi:hypothetical protein